MPTILTENPNDANNYNYYVGPEGVGWVAVTQGDLDQRVIDLASHNASLKPALVKKAWSYMYKLLEDSSVTVPVDGEPYSWGADAESRENIMGINVAITGGLPVPNPRNWTPKGATTPVSCTHTELLTIGGALLATKDAFMNVYFAHKAAIMGESDPEVLKAYDVTTGYDALL